MSKYTVEQMVSMSKDEVRRVFEQGHPIPPGSLDNTQYRGIDLTMPKVFHKLMWQTFRKTFYRDPETGILRGWNVRMEQTGWNDEGTPKQKNGKDFTFGHYHLLSAEGKTFPRGWVGQDYLDYMPAGNTTFDLGKFGYCPLVAVNKDDPSLLMGWEVFKVGGMFIPLNDYWLLKLEGPLQTVEPVPKP